MLRAVPGLHELFRIAKKKYQSVCDFAVAYGINAAAKFANSGISNEGWSDSGSGNGRRNNANLDYETYVALWLLIDRAEVRYANRVMIGVGAGQAESLGIEWWRAITNTEEEANEADAMAEFRNHREAG